MNRIVFFLSVLLLFSACQSEAPTLFESLPSGQTGVTFANQIEETEEQNILTYEYFYNGGGVAAGDLNNDGRLDLFFTGNQVENQLYLNQGGMQFEDVSERAGIGGRKGGWKTGVSLVDINADGWLDIYVCYSGPHLPEQRKNQLFINTTGQKGQQQGEVTFSEQAEAYGLADAGYSTQAVFFDYDADGDLDAFVLNHNLRGYQRQEAHVMRTARDAFAGDKLFRNEGGKFVEVSTEAGIKSNPLGFGLGVVVADINLDGLPDLYVANDYVEDDYLYLNQGNGTFRDVLREQIAHTSRFSMGLDIADVNNDTLPDIFTLDMLPEDNLRQKLLSFPDNWNQYQSMLVNGFWHQNMRNMLHLNNGIDEKGRSTFSEVGQLAGVSNTDWSWSATFADLDNDGWKDLFVTNGELRDLTNSDFIKYSADEEMKKASGQPAEALLNQIRKMPTSQTKNYVFQNAEGKEFINKQQEWGFGEPTVANGAVYADLDNDGDLDIVASTNNGPASIYRNNTREWKEKSDNGAAFLKLKLTGANSNPFGIGAKVWVNGKTTSQYQEFSPVRGFQSSIVDALHFGLGTDTTHLTIKVRWPDGKQQVLVNVKANQTFQLNYAKASAVPTPKANVQSLFRELTDSIAFTHQENHVNDFNRQILLPYQYSYTGARMASGDVNGDGLEDLYLPGARNQPGVILLGMNKGNKVQYVQQPNPDLRVDSTYEDKDALFFDADGDGDLDLYVVSGDFSLQRNDQRQKDRLYINDGKGHFTCYRSALSEELMNGSCVKAIDMDKDGDLDLFVGTNVVPGFYPISGPSFFLINESTIGKVRFRKSEDIFLGMVSDAAVLDLDKNGYDDVVVVGEWMQPMVLFNQGGKWAPAKPLAANRSLKGWWNRLAADDLDGDGDMDLVLGNLGLNTQMKASEKEPITVTYADFDSKGTFDPVMTYFIQGKPYPAVGRDEMLEQIVSLRKKFTDYASFSKATLADIFTEDQLKKAQSLQINMTETVVLENRGNDFAVHSLPVQAQYSPVYAIATGDFNGDGIKDILLCGNNATYRLRIGKMDANKGILLTGKGKWGYEYISQTQSGLNLEGDVKDIQSIGNQLIFFLNNGPVKVYEQKPDQKVVLP
jgi:enediyne biosynthesis protein E4